MKGQRGQVMEADDVCRAVVDVIQADPGKQDTRCGLSLPSPSHVMRLSVPTEWGGQKSDQFKVSKTMVQLQSGIDWELSSQVNGLSLVRYLGQTAKDAHGKPGDIHRL